MTNFIEYTLKTGISLTVLYSFFWLLLKKDTHFYLNRIILMLSVIVSVILPSIHTELFSTPHVFANLHTFALAFNTQEKMISSGLNSTPSVTGLPFNFGKVMFLIYLAGAGTVFARLIWQAIFLHAISSLSNKMEYNGYTIICMNSDLVPFSYFRRIFIPSFRMDENMLDNIIAHEKSHLNQGHFIDLIIIEILTVLQWFNPFVWFYEKSIKEVHEYLADEAVLKKGNNLGKYQALLVNEALGGPVFILTNQFNQSLIKKRIIMMKKMKSSYLAKFKAILILPLIAVLLFAFTNQQSSFSGPGKKNVTVTGNITDGTNGNPIQGGIVLIKGTTTGTISDKNGNYSITLEDDTPILIYSNIGYKTQEIPVESHTRINVQLEKDILVLDFSRNSDANHNLKTAEKKNSSENKDLYVMAEVLPEYPGGTDALKKFLEENLHYPADAKNKGLEGKVVVSFIINADGSVSNSKVMRGISTELDMEALRLVNLMKGWKPASHNGKTLSMEVTMPVEFKIQ